MNESRARRGLVFLTLLFAGAFVGCGAGTPQTAKSVAPAKSESIKASTPAAIAPAKPAEIKPVKKLSLNPFQMPEIPEEFLTPKEEPQVVETAASMKQRPRLRLLGFSNVDGFKALVELKGDVQAVAAGDLIEGVQVVSVEPPNVTFQFASSRWATKLFEQPWQNEQTGVASFPGASRSLASPSRSTPRNNRLVSTKRTPAATSTRRPAGPNSFDAHAGAGMPRIGDNTGSAIPGVPGLGSIPGMPSAGAPGGSGMPGLPGGAGPTLGGAGMPAIPGAGGMPGNGLPGSSSMPVAPGGYALPGGPPN